jgi:hypothetical protein
MPWVEIFATFIVAHLTGDYLLQTEFQASHKRGGLGRDPVRRRALGSHVASYTLAFVPALAWLAGDLPAWGLVTTALAIGIPHALQDDGRLLGAWMMRVKRTAPAPEPLSMMVDQSFHVLALFALAILVGD